MSNLGWFKVAVVPPEGQVVTTDEMKAHMRIDAPDDDELIDFFLSEAVDAVESDCNISLLERETELCLENFPPCGMLPDWLAEYLRYAGGAAVYNALPPHRSSHDPREITIGRRPITAIDWIKYFDSTNVEQTLDPTVYETDLVSPFPRIRPQVNQNWPEVWRRYNAVTVHFHEGFGVAADVPAGFKQMIRIKTVSFYENRGAIHDGLPLTAVPSPISYQSIKNRLKLRLR